MQIQPIDYFVAIKKNTQLNANTKLVLQELVSFELNPKTTVTFASDGFLAEKIGASPKTVSRAIGRLDSLGLLIRETERQPHKSRYDGSNRKTTTRYIYLDLAALDQFLKSEPIKRLSHNYEELPSRMNMEIAVEDSATDAILPVESIPSVLSINTVGYSYEVMVELLDICDELRNIVDRQFGDAPPSDDYLSGMYYYKVNKDRAYMEKYRAVFSRLQVQSA
jgi:predicted transcriptional regulator